MDRTYLEQAQTKLKLTPQERALYERHLSNLYGAGRVEHPDGSISTLYQMSVTGPDKRAYNIPTVYDGRILHPDEAIQRAAQHGWQYFPSYASPQDAEQRYGQMHEFFDQDMRSFMTQRKKSQFSWQ